MNKKKQLYSILSQVVMGLAPPRFLFQDKFTTNLTSGSVNLSSAESGPGTRHVTDPGGTRISITAQTLQHALQPGNWIDDQEWIDPGFDRVKGRTYMAKFVRSSAAGEFALGLSSSGSSTGLYIEPATLHGNAANLLVWGDPGGTNRIVGTYTGGQTYRSAVVLHQFGALNFIKGGTEYPELNLLWEKTSGSGPTLYTASVLTSGGGTLTIDDERLFDRPLPSPFAYDSFTRANGPLGSTEGIGA